MDDKVINTPDRFRRRRAPGFWTTTPDGVTAHVNGDPEMSDETLAAEEARHGK